MESSIKSCCCSEAPTMSAAEETEPRKGRISEENTEKEILGVDDGTMKPQSPLFELSSLAEKDKNGSPVFERGEPAPPDACKCNEYGFGSLEGRSQTLDRVMEALADPNTHITGLRSSYENAIKITAPPPEKVIRRAKRDNMFDVILKVNVTNKPNIKKIQDEIADGLGLKLDEKSEIERASTLHDSIKMKQKILIVICELYKAIDLRKIGIPYGADHSGCKILIISTNQDVLSDQMHTQKNFLV